MSYARLIRSIGRTPITAVVGGVTFSHLSCAAWEQLEGRVIDPITVGLMCMRDVADWPYRITDAEWVQATVEAHAEALDAWGRMQITLLDAYMPVGGIMPIPQSQYRWDVSIWSQIEAKDYVSDKQEQIDAAKIVLAWRKEQEGQEGLKEQDGRANQTDGGCQRRDPGASEATEKQKGA